MTDCCLCFRWQQVRGLVEDGIVFTKAKVDEKRNGAAGGALKEGLVGGEGSASEGEPRAAPASEPAAEAEDSDSDDGLVE